MEKNEKKKERKSLLEPNEISAQTGKNMQTRIITALVLLCICLPCVFIGSWAFLFLIFAVCVLAIYEFSIAPKVEKVPLILYIFVYIFTLSFVYWGFLRVNIGAGLSEAGINGMDFYFGIFTNGFSQFYISIIAVCISFVIYFIACLRYEHFTFKEVCYFFTMSLLIGIGFQSLYYVRYLPHFISSELVNFNDGGVGTYLFSSFLFIFILIGPVINDIGAYFVGVLFGKHKVNERISPKKTWEGLFGGIIISAIVANVFAFTCSACGVDILPGVLDINHWWNIVILSIIVPLAGIVGDFAFSAIKRTFNIKDFSHILPGHGGILDRVDSILFSFISAACILTLACGNWSFFS